MGHPQCMVEQIFPIILSKGAASHSKSVKFTKEQLEHLYKLLQSPQFSVNPSGSLDQKDTSITTLLSDNSGETNPWIMDSGAIDHITSCSNLFSTYKYCSGNKKSELSTVLSQQ